MRKIADKSESAWQTGKVARLFLEGVRSAIPGADLHFEVIAMIGDQWCGSPAHILDLGCGDGVLRRFLLARFPQAKGVFIDFSDPMPDAARRATESLSGVTVVKADFASPRWIEMAAPHGPFDIVVSGFAIHHQTDTRKRALYAEIFDLLPSDGAFLNLEYASPLREPWRRYMTTSLRIIRMRFNG